MIKTSITNEMVKYACETADLVYSGKIRRTDGHKVICEETGMSEASAAGHISAFLAMMKGERYCRVISSYATEFFLSYIGTHYGVQSQKTAAQAVLKHVEYYRGVRCNLPKIESIAKGYLKDTV